jgi:hypothetical protein
MGDKGLMERIKSFNAVVTFATSIISGLGLLATTVFVGLKAFGLIVDQESTIKLLISLVVVQALSWIAYLISAYAIRQNKKAVAISDAQFRIAVEKLVPVWSGLARSTAKCDSRIFEYLFLYRLAGEEAERPAYDVARSHIVEILDQAARAFKILTDDECAVTIKCAFQRTNTLQTIYRDQISDEKRGGARDQKIERLSENKPMDDVAVAKIPYYVEDNLEAAFKKGEYTNSRADWRKYYNATIVHPVEIHASRSKRTGAKVLGNMTFMICVDNKKGGFSTAISLDTIRYVSNRVSALVYRAEMLKI